MFSELHNSFRNVEFLNITFLLYIPINCLYIHIKLNNKWIYHNKNYIPNIKDDVISSENFLNYNIFFFYITETNYFAQLLQNNKYFDAL